MNVDDIVKYLFFISTGILCLIIGRPTIENFLDANQSLQWFHDIESSFKLDLCVLLVTVFYSAIRINTCATEQPNKTVTYVVIFAIIFYSYERIFSDYFEFLPFEINSLAKHSFSKLAYLDVIYWLALLYIAPYLKELKPKSKQPLNNQLVEDKPIENKNEDGLEGLFELPADKIKNIIANNLFQNSLTIGLNGEWGSGKTSVFNLVKNKISSDDNVITMDFNPWMGFDKKVLVKDFFNSLSETLGGSFSEELNSYANEILDNTNSPSFLKIIQSITFKKEKSLEALFEDINKKIEKLNKKIVVFIDDVDRLDKEEIFEILKLIRKTANFKQMYFILAYDRAYVNNSIKDQSGVSVIKYLDKIINVEIGLPYYDKSILTKYFIELLRKNIPINLQHKIEYYIKSFEKTAFILDLNIEREDLFLYWISNFREIKKLINSIHINYSDIYSQINLVDVIQLEILKLKHPQLHSYLYVKQDEILAINPNRECFYLRPIDSKKHTSRAVQDYLKMSKSPSMQSNSNDEARENQTFFDVYLEGYAKDNNINEIEKQKILDLVEKMFRRWNGSHWFGESISDIEDELSVKYVNKFERYFSHTVFSRHLNEDDFKDFLQSKPEDLEENILAMQQNGQSRELCSRLNRKFKFSNQLEYVNTVTTSLLLLNSPKHSIDDHQLTAKMFDQEFTQIFPSTEFAKDFFIQLFTKPTQENAKILIKLNERNERRKNNDSTRFPLKEGEINNILERYMLNEIENTELFTPKFWRMYHYCQKQESHSYKTPFSTVNQKIIEQLSTIDTILKFLKSLVLYEGYGDESTIRKQVIIDLFETSEEFENQILDSLDDTDGYGYIKNFKDYYQQSKKKDFGYITFDYDFIKQSITSESRYITITDEIDE